MNKKVPPAAAGRKRASDTGMRASPYRASTRATTAASDCSTYFEITSTVFYSPVTPGKKSKTAFMFHHGHSNCICPMEKGDPVINGAKCRCAPQLSYGGSLRCRP